MTFLSIMIAAALVSNFALGGITYLALREVQTTRRELTQTRALLLAELARLQPRVIEVPAEPTPPTAEVLPFAPVLKNMLERSLHDLYGMHAA